MKPLTKLQSLLLGAGAVLMVVGAVCFVARIGREWVCWLFLAGTLLFSVIHSMQLYEGRSTVVRRLKRMANLADLLLLLSGILMVDTSRQFLLPLFRMHGTDGYLLYIEYVYNKWVLLLLVAALLILYTTLRMGSEMNRKDAP